MGLLEGRAGDLEAGAGCFGGVAAFGVGMKLEGWKEGVGIEGRMGGRGGDEAGKDGVGMVGLMVDMVGRHQFFEGAGEGAGMAGGEGNFVDRDIQMGEVVVHTRVDTASQMTKKSEA